MPRGGNELGELGERVAGLAARFEAFESYEHDRWHQLNNDLTPLVNIEGRIARDLAKMEGRITATIEATVDKAIAREVKPINDDVLELKAEVASLRVEIEQLKAKGNQLTGAKQLAVWIVQTLIAAIAALGAIMAMGRVQ